MQDDIIRNKEVFYKSHSTIIMVWFEKTVSQCVSCFKKMMFMKRGLRRFCWIVSVSLSCRTFQQAWSWFLFDHCFSYASIWTRWVDYSHNLLRPWYFINALNNEFAWVQYWYGNGWCQTTFRLTCNIYVFVSRVAADNLILLQLKLLFLHLRCPILDYI